MNESILFAGMPFIGLADVAKLRLEVISFFLFLFVLSGFALRWVWNGLARDFPRLPKLSYGRAVGVMVVWSALFVLVLTMISGARELMTPGAWKKDGVTYKLAEDSKSESVVQVESDRDRRQKLEALRFELWNHAAKHDGQFPPDRDSIGIAREVWLTTHVSGIRFLYLSGLQQNTDKVALLAVEPDVFMGMRFGLFTDGVIRVVNDADLVAAFIAKAGP